MKLLIIGAGGVGTSAAKIIQLAGAEGDWAEKVVVADFNEERAKVVANEICGGGKFVPAFVNAMDSESIKAVVAEHGIDFAMNCCPQRDFSGAQIGVYHHAVFHCGQRDAFRHLPCRAQRTGCAHPRAAHSG